MQNIVIIGATSSIAKSVIRQLGENARLFLVARDPEKLSLLVDDMSARYTNVVTGYECDLADLDSHAALVEKALATLSTIDVVLVAHGTLPDQEAIENDVSQSLKEITVNGLSVVSLCSLFATQMERQGNGCIAVISSVAGDRGRQSNYIYGSAKAMVSTFLQGLRNRLASKGVHVLTIKPGFVDTPMTAHVESKGALWATPEKVASDIIKAIEKKRNVIYTPFFWRYIMTVIKSVPEFIFKKLKL